MINSDDITITEFIYQILINNGYSVEDANFETIIAVVEDLLLYHSSFKEGHDLPSLMKCVFDSKFDVRIMHFSTDRDGHGYRLQIPPSKEYVYSHNSYHNETKNQFFLQHLLGEILTEISSRISKYSYHTTSHSVIDLGIEVSKAFCSWVNLIKAESILRCYTLNYDNIFKVLLQACDLEVFDGFTSLPVGPGECYRPDVVKILTDVNSTIHYNLHGSSYWKVFDVDHHQLPNPEIGLQGMIHLQGNDSPASIQIEKGRTLLVSNIITGFQKAQKSMITPFKQMQASFDKDCCLADEILIVGYSFGDEHINQSLKSALRYNKNLKIIIVDPSFIEKKKDEELALKIFPYRDSASFTPKKEGQDFYSYLDRTVVVYTVTFANFLNNPYLTVGFMDV